MMCHWRSPSFLVGQGHADERTRDRQTRDKRDYLSVPSSIRASCQPRHRRARVAPAAATRRTIGLRRPEHRTALQLRAR
eukprot:4565240-Prymnesium_polylepis.1